MKPRVLAVFIGVIGLLALALGTGWGGAAPAGATPAKNASLTAAQGAGSAAGPGGQALATAARPGPPRRVGAGPKLPRGARRLGALATSAKINVDVMLAPGDAAGLAAYAANVSSPGNALYHHYLSIGQLAATFGPSAAAVSAVEASLRTAGLTPGPLSADHLLLPVTATAKQLAAAFSTSFDQYQLASGRVAFANTAAPLLSGAAAPYVQAVVGLDSLTVPEPVGLPRSATLLGPAKAGGRVATGESPHVVTGGPQPCATIAAPAAQRGLWTADQLAAAYNFSGLYGVGDQGTGQTIALLELEPDLPSDIAAYQSCYGTSTTVKYISELGGVAAGPGSGEAAADIETIIGLAPKATIDVYQAPNTVANAVSEMTDIVDSGTANVVSTSWGLCESLMPSQQLAAENNTFEMAAAHGESVFAAAGDDGSTDCPSSSALTVDDPASQPLVTAVGGTTLNSVSPLAQTTWNDTATDPAGAGGGGLSSVHAMPSYQSSAPAALNVVNLNSSGTPCRAGGSLCREVPDVSASADLAHGYVIFLTFVVDAQTGQTESGWLAAGGTSLAAPLWAALTALTDETSTCAGTPIGFANPLLYKAAAASYAANFADVTSGSNDFTPDGNTSGLYPAGAGYDMATGLGTPNGAALARSLCSGGGAANTVTVTNPGTQTTTVGATVSLQAAATDSGGAALTFTAAGLPPGLSVSPSGLISGSPTAAGTYPVTLTATDTASASGSASFTFTVKQAPQKISFTALGAGMAGGSAALSATGGASGNPVVFSVDGTSGPGVCSVSSATVSYLAVGSCVLDANQAGNANYSVAPQATQTITVGQGTQTITFSNLPATGTVGGSDVLSAAGGASGNAVVLSLDASSGAGVCALSGSKVSYLAAGSCVIDANQAGNASYAPAQLVVETITVTAAGGQPQTITFNNPPATGTVGGSDTLSATGGGSGNPVTFSVDASSGNGVCAVSGDHGSTVTYTAAGSCVIDADQAAGDGFAAAQTVAVTITVGPAGAGSQAITFNNPPQTGTVGGSDTLSATGGGSGNPVTFALDASSGDGVCSVAGDTVSYLAAGSCVIDADQAAGGGFTAAQTVVLTITVTAAGGQPQTITLNNFPATGTVGGSDTLSATGGGSNNPVVFSVDGSSGDGVCAVSGDNGSTVTYTAAGSCVIDADQPGNADFAAAQTVTETITVDPGPQAITFNNPPQTGTVGGSDTLSATGGGSGNPVTFSVDASSGDGVCAVSGDNGSTVSYTAAGSCVIDADQAGDADYNAAQTASVTITVTGGPAFVTDSPPLTATAGQPYDYVFTASGTPAPTYALADGAPSWLSADAGTGEVTGTPPAGTTTFTYSVTAANSGGSATAGPFTVTVSAAGGSTKADVSAALTCPATLTAGATGTCTLTVANAGPAAAGKVVAGVRLPAQLSEVSCTADCARHRNVFTWSLDTLASGASTQFAVTVKASAAGKATVLAAAVAQNRDPHWRNNISVQRITVSRAPGTKGPGPGRHPGHGQGWPGRKGGR